MRVGIKVPRQKRTRAGTRERALRPCNYGVMIAAPAACDDFLVVEAYSRPPSTAWIQQVSYCGLNWRTGRKTGGEHGLSPGDKGLLYPVRTGYQDSEPSISTAWCGWCEEPVWPYYHCVAIAHRLRRSGSYGRESSRKNELGR